MSKQWNGNMLQTPVPLRRHAPKQTEEKVSPRLNRQPKRSDAHGVENDDAWKVEKPHTSVFRYDYPTTSQGDQVIQQGNKRIIIHQGAPKRRIHWVFVLWIGMLSMIAFYLLWNWGNSWWTNHQLDSTYGFPRTYQVDEVVGIDDSTDHPSHFIFLNLSGRIEIIFLPGGDATRAKIYQGPQLYSDNAPSIPVTGEFKDVGNGKVDMIVHIGEQRIIYLNNGTDFKPQGG